MPMFAKSATVYIDMESATRVESIGSLLGGNTTDVLPLTFTGFRFGGTVATFFGPRQGITF